MFYYIVWTFTLIALIGTFLNTRQIKEGFIFWFIADIFFVGHNYLIGEFAQSLLFLVYTFLALYGYFQWNNPK